MPEQEQHPLILPREHWTKIHYLVDRTHTRKDISTMIKHAETFARIATRGLAKARSLKNEASARENLLDLMFHTETLKLLRKKLLQVRRARH